MSKNENDCSLLDNIEGIVGGLKSSTATRRHFGLNRKVVKQTQRDHCSKDKKDMSRAPWNRSRR